ncbi:ricin B lectin domain-containing protein [Collybia nuda]|uniref:Ricin B lectin domain-containing protein n=1 Tax=Collybia nuda TaxID=64659 RepID=A0A9P5XW80_9AGAR|nr:ricin B lectin domain-containing protein [Collybia nuda]
MKFPVLIVSLFAIQALATRKYSIVNSCPSAVTLYINGESQGLLAANGGTTTRDFPNTWSGFIYTDANGGNQNGAGTTRAGFSSNYYYMVADTQGFNTGISITPVNRGYCFIAQCDTVTCPDAFQQPPTRFPLPQSGIPPQSPLFECPQADTGYFITFCPSGRFPNTQTGANAIHPNGNSNKCLDVKGTVFQNGTPVQIYDCNGTQAQKWAVQRGNTKVKLSGTNYCLDAGSTPGKGVGMKIWQCYDNLPALVWYYTDDNRIALTGKGTSIIF